MRLFFTAITLVFASTLFAQSPTGPVKLGAATNGTTKLAELSYSLSKDTVYSFSFVNQQNPQKQDWQAFSFSKQENVDKLYGAMKSVFTDKNKNNRNYSLALNLGGEDVLIGNHRELGTLYAAVVSSLGYIRLTEKQVDELFGKIR